MLSREVFGKSYYFIISFAILQASALHAHPFRDSENSATHRHVLSKRLITQQDRTFYKFVTRPDIDAPVFDIQVRDEEAVAPGYWFVAPHGQLGQDRPGQKWDGPHIYDGNGELVWSGTPMFGYWNIFDFESRTVDGQAMITLLSDHEKHGFILDNTYQIRKTVSLLHGKETKPNMHSFNVFDDGKRALLLTHTDEYTTKAAAKAVGFDGKCNAKYQGFREVSLESPASQDVVFEWDAKDHIQLDEVTYRKYDGSIEQQCTRGWDILHLNSIVKFPDGDYLLSARHTDAVYKISHEDGSIVWRLGGMKSDFQQDDWKFSRQHHAQVLEQNATHTTLTIFDNGIGDGPFEHASSDRARGLVVLLDTVKMRADITGEYEQPKGERTNARGSFQTLPNGNKFICWAYNSFISEHTPDGTVVMEAMIPIKLRSYRAFKHPWVGKPKQPPDIHSEAIALDKDLVTAIYVSWNGDTRTVKWEFSEIDERGNAHLLGSTKRRGFETRLEFHSFARRVFAEAIDVNGNRLGKSEVAITVRPPFLKEGGWSPGAVIAGETEHSPALQDDEKYGEAASLVDHPGKTFAIGIACGAAVFTVVWAFVGFFKGRASALLRQRRETKYMPLKQDTDG